MSSLTLSDDSWSVAPVVGDGALICPAVTTLENCSENVTDPCVIGCGGVCWS